MDLALSFLNFLLNSFLFPLRVFILFPEQNNLEQMWTGPQGIACPHPCTHPMGKPDTVMHQPSSWNQARSQLGMSKDGDSFSQSNYTTPQFLLDVTHPPPVSPQGFDAGLVTLLACLSSPLPSESRWEALHFSPWPSVPSSVSDTLEALANCQMNKHR